MVKGFEGGNSIIEKWFRNKNTLEFLAVWETLNNDDFNSPVFEGIRKEAGSNRFTISVKQWCEKTKAVGIMAKAGRYGGTYAHKDIAFEFGTWLSPEFKLILIKEFQRLKDFESKTLNLEWDFRRFLSKVNYKVHTDSVKEHLIPISGIPKESQWLVYAEEADILNFALFGITAQQWKDKYPDRILQGRNIRDYADIHELTVLSNLESYNSILINQGMDKVERFKSLRNAAINQLKTLRGTYTIGSVKSPFIIEDGLKKETGDDFDSTLGTIMNIPKLDK